MRSSWFKQWWKAATALVLVAALAAGVAFSLSAGHALATPVTGADFTTVNPADGPSNVTCLNGNGANNCNIYTDKNYVWLTGGPSSAALGDGTYFFAVLDPGGQNDPNDGAAGNLSWPNDAYTNRTFSISGGSITYNGTHDFSNNLIRLMPYNDTANPGGVYIMAICSLASNYPVMASACKYDAFKVQTGQVVPGNPLTITKDAAGVYTNQYTWQIQKSVDKTVVKQVGGSVIFNYTVTVTHDGGTISGVSVTGKIDVTNPNVDNNNNTVGVAINGVTDQLSDGTNCVVTNGGAQTLTAFDTPLAYTCALSSLPQGQLDNTATVSWPDQFLDNGATLNAGSATFKFSAIAFTPTLVDSCVAVTDTFNGTATTLGSPCVSSATNPTVYTYSHTVPVPQFNCVTYKNTATFTTNTNGTTGSASQSVRVCGPAQTGALTMGFWQNKNGQYIITHTASTSGSVCNLTTWLRQYAPYQEQSLSATASCTTVATYVYNVIKAANAGGATMNAMLKAQMLATALDVYYSDPALGGNRIGAYNGLGSNQQPVGSFVIDLTQVCAMIDSAGGSATCSGSYENVSAAFGSPPPASLSISQMLSYAASQSNPGGSVWYGQVKATQGLAKDAFDAINNQVAFGA